MNAIARGTLIGLLIVVLVGLATVAAVYGGWLPDPRESQAAEPILVIASAPDDSGTEVAAVAFTIQRATGEVALLSTVETATVPGTSAATPRDALPFGGGAAVARALAPQTGGVTLEWVVVPPSVWAELVDAADGISVDVPEALNAYSDGRLVSVGSGRQKLDGDKAAVVAAAAPYLGALAVQERVLGEVSAGVSAVIGNSGTRLREAVSSGVARSSLDSAEIPDFSAE